MAYIEENMKLRHGGQQQPALKMDTSTVADKGKVSSSATDTTVGAKLVGPVHHHLDLDPQYIVERKLDKQGSLTNSLAMFTAISSPHRSRLTQIPWYFS